MLLKSHGKRIQTANTRIATVVCVCACMYVCIRVHTYLSNYSACTCINIVSSLSCFQKRNRVMILQMDGKFGEVYAIVLVHVHVHVNAIGVKAGSYCMSSVGGTPPQEKKNKSTCMTTSHLLAL